MDQPRRGSRAEMPTQPHMMPDERLAPGREPPGREAQRPPRGRTGRAPERRRARPPGARRAAPPQRGARGAGPQRGPRHRPGRKGRARGAPWGRRRLDIDVRHWRAFAFLVVVPVLLMLGSIYTHAAAGGLSERVAELEERRGMAEVRQENLDLRLTELTAPERIRSEARELGLREPVGNMKVYGSQGEDGTDAAGQAGEERSR